MSYTVIARRWRPKKFDDVIGQPHIITTIKNSIKYNRIAHAYLFTGPRGIGKTSLARILAKAVNCKDGPREEPCGQCENCLAIDNNSFVDIIEIDAASARKIEDIRDLTETVRYLPMKGMYKVYILDEAHMLTDQARNAFLKTLEEPPGHNIFVLATTEAHKIPYTIMSRCQRFDFRRISEKDISEQLKKICDHENIGYDEGIFQYISLEADGSLRDAESILDQIISYSGNYIKEKDVINIIGIVERDVIYRMTKSIVDGDLKSGLDLLEKTMDEGYDIYQIYRGLISFFRNMMIIKACGDIPPFIFIGEQEKARISELMKDLEYYEIQNMLNHMLKVEYLLRGPFPKVSLEILYINLYNIAKLREVDKFLDSLGRQKDEEFDDKVFINEKKNQYYDAEPTRDVKGFIEYLKKKKPFISTIFENLNVIMEENTVVIFLDENYSFIKDDSNLKEEIGRHLDAFFGKNMVVIFKEADEKKRSILEEYVKEAESLFDL